MGVDLEIHLVRRGQLPQYPVRAIGPGAKRIKAGFVSDVEPRQEHARETNAQAEEVGQRNPSLANDVPAGDCENIA